MAMIASLVGDPARSNMLTALMSGRALTATELAQEAGITAQTASSHLSKLEAGHLVVPEKQGRHRYFRLSGPDVAAVLEGLMGLAARAGHLRVRTGPADPGLRRARVCYDHLAGDLGVRMLDSMTGRKLLRAQKDSIALTPQGERFVADLGIDLPALGGSRRPLCKTCLDWSVRRSHLAGSLGAASCRGFTNSTGPGAKKATASSPSRQRAQHALTHCSARSNNATIRS
jgi:DNA-binding transcriptional ArsR family regulator